MRGSILLTIICGVLSLLEANEMDDFVEGNRLFTAALYKDIAQNERENFIASPISVETVLALLNEGARGVTSDELIKGLSFPNTKENIQAVFKTILPQFKKDTEELKLLSANKIYVKPELPLENNFKLTATSIYDSDVSNIDFAKNNEAAEIINKWVELSTNHRIRNLLKTDRIDKRTSIVLINALYFSGKWLSEFKSVNTRKAKFFRSLNDIIDVDTMYQNIPLNYFENQNLDAKFLELPIKDSEVNMVIVLPNKVGGLPNLENNLQQLLTRQPFSKLPVGLALPKFVTETFIDFKPILQKLGIKKLFEDADLNGLTPASDKLLISDIIQKAFINVTESGIDAAGAAPGPASGPTIPLETFLEGQYSFQADRPFLYYIKHGEIILFVGRVTNPSN